MELFDILKNFLSGAPEQAAQNAGDKAKALPPGGPGAVPEEDLYALHRARNAGSAATDKLTQDLIGPKEHEQFVQETTALNPLQGFAVTAVSPIYTGLKALGVKGFQGRSAASTDEIIGAGAGFVKGLNQYFSGGAVPTKMKPTLAAAGLVNGDPAERTLI